MRYATFSEVRDMIVEEFPGTGNTRNLYILELARSNCVVCVPNCLVRANRDTRMAHNGLQWLFLRLVSALVAFKKWRVIPTLPGTVLL